jgi:hypothetical protein
MGVVPDRRPEPRDDAPLDAGAAGPWAARTIDALEGRAEADVPCGTCVACCSSRQFVHIEPDEVDALAHVPVELRFPAPGLPAGHVVLPYDAAGRCPMLGDHGCTIYDHRPRTCRIYDCRIFTAAGLAPDDDQPLIAAQVRRWRFTERPGADGERDRLVLEAVRATAGTLLDPAAHPDGRVPPRASHVAAMAVGLHELAIEPGGVRTPEPGAVRVVLARRRGG